MSTVGYERVKSLYEKLFEQSELTDMSDEGFGMVHVWEGKATHVYQELDMPMSHYSSVWNTLKDLGCVLQIQRGGPSSTTKYLLYHAPTLEDFAQRGSNRSRDYEAKPAKAIEALKGKLMVIEGEMTQLKHKLSELTDFVFELQADVQRKRIDYPPYTDNGIIKPGPVTSDYIVDAIGDEIVLPGNELLAESENDDAVDG